MEHDGKTKDEEKPSGNNAIELRSRLSAWLVARNYIQKNDNAIDYGVAAAPYSCSMFASIILLLIVVSWP